MTHSWPPTYRSATSDDVLAVICDAHRQQCQFDSEAEPDARLGPETTVDEWRIACDLVDWRQLGRALNDDWGLDHSDAAWYAVLEPSRERRLGELCGFIARGALMPCIRPAGFFGTSCTAAGAFLSVRSILSDAGADVRAVAPSTPLAPYTRRHLSTFLGPISRLAPNALPAVKVSTPWYDSCLIGIVVGLLIAVVGWFFSPLATTLGSVLAGVSYVEVWVAAAYPPSSVEFGTLRTFGDLSRVIAEGAQGDERGE